MHIERTDHGNVTVLRLEGNLDEGGIDAIRESLLECLSQGRFNLIINLHKVRFFSYMGVGILVERLRKCRSANGDLKLVGMNLCADRLFRMVGISSLFETYESEPQAIAVFQEAA